MEVDINTTTVGNSISSSSTGVQVLVSETEVTVNDSTISVEVSTPTQESTVNVTTVSAEVKGNTAESIIIGIAGVDGSNAPITLTAGETISAYRCVYVGTDGDFYRLISSDTTNCFAFAGIITNSVDANDEAEIKQEGILTNTSWSFAANQPVFLGASGEVTQTVPTSGFLLRLGFATTSQSILFNVAELTILGV